MKDNYRKDLAFTSAAAKARGDVVYRSVDRVIAGTATFQDRIIASNAVRCERLRAGLSISENYYGSIIADALASA